MQRHWHWNRVVMRHSCQVVSLATTAAPCRHHVRTLVLLPWIHTTTFKEMRKPLPHKTCAATALGILSGCRKLASRSSLHITTLHVAKGISQVPHLVDTAAIYRLFACTPTECRTMHPYGGLSTANCALAPQRPNYGCGDPPSLPWVIQATTSPHQIEV